MSGDLREQLDTALAENRALQAANTKLVLAERDRLEAALRSAATTGAEYTAGFEACRSAAHDAVIAARDKFGSPVGDAYDNGVWDQSQRINFAIAALPAPAGESVTGWRPIETAPKDGTEILLFTHHEADEYFEESFDAVQIGSWDEGNPDTDWYREAGWELQRIGTPTHWQPLPPAPSITRKSEARS